MPFLVLLSDKNLLTHKHHFPGKRGGWAPLIWLARGNEYIIAVYGTLFMHLCTLLEGCVSCEYCKESTNEVTPKDSGI